VRKKNQTLNSVDNPLFRYWNALYMAFYSRRFYVDVCKRWRGYGFTYLLLLIVFASIPLSIRIVIDFNHFFKEQMIDPIKQLPTIYVQNGQISLDKSMPYLIKNKLGEVVAVVDTASSYAEMAKFYPKLTLLLTQNTIYFKPPQLKLFLKSTDENLDIHVFENAFTGSDNGLFEGNEWINSSGVMKLMWATDALVFPTMAVFFFSLYLIFMMALTLLAQAFAWMIFKTKLKYRETCRLSLTAITAQVIVFFALLTMHANFPGLGLLQVALFAIYFSYAVLSVKRESKKMVFA